MVDNPFGDVPDEPAKKYRYLVLISAGRDNAAMVQKMLRNIQESIDAKATPLWIDSKGIGVFVESDLVASEVWNKTLETIGTDQLSDTKDMLVLELGEDWAARKDAKPMHWLATHIGSPRAPTRGSRQRR